MAMTNQNDEMFAGNNRTIRYTVVDQDTAGNPPKDVTGLDFRWALCRFSAAGDVLKTPLLEFTTASPSKVNVTDAPNGVVEVYLAHADTATLAAGDYYMELEAFVTLSGFSLVVATGTLTINVNVGAS